MGIFDIFKRKDNEPEAIEPETLVFMGRMAETMPRDRDGKTILLDDTVRCGKRAFDVVAVSHRGRIALRKHGADRGAGAFWTTSAAVARMDEESEAGHAS